MNLFLSTRSLTAAREDHLTEFFAAALEVSEPMRSGYYDLAIRPYAAAQGWRRCHIVDISTQCLFAGTTCCPDMVLTLSNGKRIACEHKIESPETMGPQLEESGQLGRYLRLPIDGLVYVRASWKPPELAVLRHPRYIRPRIGEHFLWRDFYPLLTAAKDPLARWLREGFERLGYTPHSQVGDLATEAERRNFAKLWAKTRSHAHGLGWHVGAGSIVQLYLKRNRRSLASEVFIQPVANRFQIRVTPHRSERDRCCIALRSAAESCSWPVQFEENTVARTGGKTNVCDLYVSAVDLLGRRHLAPHRIEDRLFRFVSGFLDVLQTS